MAMGNCRRCLRKLLCCSHDACTAGAHQGIQNPPSGSLQSPSTADALLPAVNPQGPVWLQQPLKELEEMLDLGKGEPLSRVVVIYGCAGIGKTTLANALIATLAQELKYYKCIKVEIKEDPLRNDFRVDLEKSLLNSVTEPAFIFLDNALRLNDLEVSLLKILRGRFLIRMLVTTRDLPVTDLFKGDDIRCRLYAVNRLARKDALKILCDDPTHLDQIRNLAERITEIADGIPLVLEIVGAYLRKQKYKVENCSRILKAFEHQRDLTENLVHFVYDDLEPSTQEAFLDICSFFNGWRRRLVEYILGVEEVRLLAESALVTSLPFVTSVEEFKGSEKDFVVSKEFHKEGIYLAEEDKLIVQNVVKAEGRRMGESSRIKDSDSWAATSQGQTIKGLKLDSVEAIGIGESELTRMSDSVRILILGSGISVSARSNQKFKELRCLILNGQIRSFPMHLEWHPSLSFYIGPFAKELLIKLPPKLKYLMPTSVDESSKPFLAVRNSSLEHLDLTGPEIMRVLFDGRVRFDALKIVSLERWVQMEEFPPQLRDLPSLNKLILRGCGHLKCVPESIASLIALTHLDLSDCKHLEEVSSSLGNLTALRYLDLTSCEVLRKLPDDFGQLSALECLSLSECKSLKELPSNFGQLSALEFLSLNGCGRLQELPGNFAELRSLKHLHLAYCMALTELPPNFGQLSALECLSLNWCPFLKELPGNFAELRSLKHLNLDDCVSLKELPPNFGQLSALECLSLHWCTLLQELPGNFAELRSLKHLDLTSCAALKELPPNFGQLSSLEHLSLSDCSKLQELPGDVAQLKSLKRLQLIGCYQLERFLSSLVQLTGLQIVGP